MKRYTVLFFVLVTLLAVSGVSLANDLSWWPCFYDEGPIPVKGYLGVLGTVGEYASIKVCPAPVSLEWSGKGYETQWAIADLEIKSNTAIQLGVEFAALRQGFYSIPTTVALKPSESFFWPTFGWSGTNDGSWSTPTTSFTIGNWWLPLQGVAKKNYDVWVSGTLGDIQDQAAGLYGTVVVFTVAKAS